MMVVFSGMADDCSGSCVLSEAQWKMGKRIEVQRPDVGHLLVVPGYGSNSLSRKIFVGTESDEASGRHQEGQGRLKVTMLIGKPRMQNLGEDIARVLGIVECRRSVEAFQVDKCNGKHDNGVGHDGFGGDIKWYPWWF
ncbi:hypothetical protein Nepgr_024114 [Nepenthes gracilis]|uniref:Uncharacterized protein n=1 Tax=Nepenthes gracilis TaxID=150966 RepID=A0AAD3T437_NEPGR|nr:hypothetical protein Nepgr_024114 [Nepenthes gracilis]